MDLVPIYLHRLEVTADLIRNVKPDQLGDPTPCEDYDVRALLNHVIGAAAGIAAGAAGTARDDSPDPIAAVGGDPGAAIDRVLPGVREAWATPGAGERTFPGGQVLLIQIATVEAVVHGWDIAMATGQPYEIPDVAAAPLLEGMKRGTGGERRPGGPFGPIVELRADASAADQLIAFTGRRP